MNEQDGTRSSTLQRPTTNDREAWKAYWQAQEQLWRTEPEIDAERQKYLDERRSITPDIEKGIYPFKDIKLSRADVEWLLATHENGRGPVDWSDESQRTREGLDLRGAHLCEVDLSDLPLAQLCGGLTWTEWLRTTEGQRHMASIVMERTDLRRAHLEGANLRWAQMREAYLNEAQMQSASFSGAHMEAASFFQANMEDSLLYKTHLEGASLYEANLKEADLCGAYLDEADLTRVILVDEKSIGPRLPDVQWGNTNLAVVDWSVVKILGDERRARQREKLDGKPKIVTERLREYEQAVRANRQLAVALRNQGLNEDAARFAFRAQLLQRVVLRRQRKLGQYLFSLFLDLFAGYGYRPWRSFLAYLLVISIFTLIYHQLGPHLAWNEAIIISMTAFHGRGFFPDQFKPGDPQAMFAALEAFVGLIIEVTFIATLTRRFFGQ